MQRKTYPVWISRDTAVQATRKLRSYSHPGLWLCGLLSGSARLCATLSRWLSRATARLSFEHPLVCEFVRELRTFALRSKTLLFQRSIALADMGPVAGTNGSGVPIYCSRTHGRMQDITKFLAVRPLASQEDRNLFLAGWNYGARWADDNLLILALHVKVTVLLHVCLLNLTSATTRCASLREGQQFGNRPNVIG